MAPEPMHLERIRLSSAYQRNTWNAGTGTDTPGVNPVIIYTSTQHLERWHRSRCTWSESQRLQKPKRNAWNAGTGADAPGANPVIICISAQHLEQWHGNRYTWSESGYHLHTNATPGTLAP